LVLLLQQVPLLVLHHHYDLRPTAVPLRHQAVAVGCVGSHACQVKLLQQQPC
jgi:hypothetical protein